MGSSYDQIYEYLDSIGEVPEGSPSDHAAFVSELVDSVFWNAVGFEELEKEGVQEPLPSVISEEETSQPTDICLYEDFGEAATVRSVDVIRYLLRPESVKSEELAVQPGIPEICKAFGNHVDYARDFIENILENAKELCFVMYGVPVKSRKKPTELQNITWPSIEHFTIELGARKIDEYVQMTFEVEENWLYKINFVAAQSDLSSDVYLYEAIFCIPTPCYPVAQVTASIYFNCEVSRVKPPECPINVTYTVESLRDTLVPGKHVVNDDILLRLLYSKLAVFKSTRF